MFYAIYRHNSTTQEYKSIISLLNDITEDFKMLDRLNFDGYYGLDLYYEDKKVCEISYAGDRKSHILAQFDLDCIMLCNTVEFFSRYIIPAIIANASNIAVNG